jgi:hypothetical protein
MSDSYYPAPSQFSPSLPTIQSWLGTRKSNTVNRTGLLETVGFSKDQGWTIIAILIEIMALGLTIVGALRAQNNTRYVIGAIIIVILFVTLDIIGVKMFHAKSESRTVLRNRLSITVDPVLRGTLDKQIKEWSFGEFLGLLLMVISAGLKILGLVAFFGIKGSGSIMLIAVIFIFYLVVIYIHSSHTGYWLAAVQTSRKMRREYDKWVDSNSKGLSTSFGALTYSRLYTSSLVMQDGVKVFHNGRQKLELVSSAPGQNGQVFTYRISSVGLMWDSDISSLAALFTDRFAHELRAECIRLQMTMIGHDGDLAGVPLAVPADSSASAAPSATV